MFGNMKNVRTFTSSKQQDMKNLTLEVVESGKSHPKYIYNVIEDGEVIAQSTSNRRYVACYVTEYDTNAFGISFFFGRIELIVKGDSKKWIDEGHKFYAVAIETV